MAVYGHPEAANLTYLGLYALQHRGQEAAGIVSANDGIHRAEIGMGLVSEIFTSQRLENLTGDIAIGHNRYSTHGAKLIRNAQPISIRYADGPLALAHNGNLVTAEKVRAELEKEGSIFRSDMDSEVIVHLVARSRAIRLQDRLIEALRQMEGAFSLVVMGKKELIAVRDPRGFRPLAMGRIGNGYVFASETCAFDLIDAEFIRELDPGEMVIVDDEGITSLYPFEKQEHKHCIFEYIYFARPDSLMFGENVHKVRKEFGRQLARELPVSADMVIPVPDSGIVGALGYAEESGISYEKAIIRNHYVGRTFIEPTQSIRHFGVKIKLNTIKEIIEGKRVILVDDSIVRGTTSKKVVKMVRDAGAKEVHMRVSSPPTINPCYYGVDTPSKSELIASTYSTEQVCEYLGADTLAYLSIDGMLRGVHNRRSEFCKACFDGDYPTDHVKNEVQLQIADAKD